MDHLDVVSEVTTQCLAVSSLSSGSTSFSSFAASAAPKKRDISINVDRNYMLASLQFLGQQRNIGVAVLPKLLKFVLVFVALGPQVAVAQEAQPESDAAKWGVSLGVFITEQNMRTDFDANFNNPSIKVDFENDLGLDESQSVGRFAAFYKFNERHQLDFDIFDLSQNATAVLDTEISWQDTIFSPSEEISTSLDLRIYKIAYTYLPWQNDKGRLGVTGGLYIADIGLFLRVPESDLREVGDVTAPLPVIGLRGEYYFSERWRASASIELFAVEVDEYRGHLQDNLVAIDYLLTDHAALGLGYNHVEIDVDATEKDLRADLTWQYSGVMAYLRLTF